MCAIQPIPAGIFFPSLSYTSFLLCAFSSESIFGSGSIAFTFNGSSSIFGGWYAGVIESIGISDSLGGRGGFLHTGSLYLDCSWRGLSPKDGMVIGGGSGLKGAIGGGAALGSGCSIVWNFGLIVFLLAPALPCPFLGSTGKIILWSWDTDLGITGMGLGIPSLLYLLPVFLAFLSLPP